MDSIEIELEELMLLNQPLKCWELVKDTNSPLKDAVYAKVRHAFDPKEYQKFYREDLNEVPFPKRFTYGCDRIVPRYSWLMQFLLKNVPESVLDIGCGSGELGTTLGVLEIPSTGLNLYNPSVVYARKMAQEKNIGSIATFLNLDFFDYDVQHDVVVFFDLLEHMPDPKKALEKIYSLVKKGGRLYISTPDANSHEGIRQNRWVRKPNSWMDGKPSGHLQLWNEDALKRLLKEYRVTEFTKDIMGNLLAEVKK